jgi:sugar lactone lactonase YvrE
LNARTPGVHTLLTGLAYGESPRWHDGRLWFSNWTAQEIIAVDLSGESEVVVRLPYEEFPFSIDWLQDGRLLIVSASERPLIRREVDGSLVDHARLEKGWNEIVVDGRGNAYINRSGFDLMKGEEFRPGTITLVAADGSSRQVADGMHFPNGMAITPDNGTLIAAESYGRRLTAFNIEPDGCLSNRRNWADLGDGVPDGICIDAEGAVWDADVPNRRCVRVREGGEVVQTVQADRGCFACMLGGVDGKTLFILAAEWHGPTAMASGPRTGQVLYAAAPAAGTGSPTVNSLLGRSRIGPPSSTAVPAHSVQVFLANSRSQ